MNYVACGQDITRAENNILCIVCPQDMTEVLEPTELMDDSEPLMALGHRFWVVPTACRNRICVKPHMKV